MRTGLFVALYYALLVVSAFGVCYGRAVDSTRQSLLGTWRGEFRLDTVLAQLDLSGQGPQPSTLTIEVAADTAPAEWPLPPWQQAFVGRYAPTRGRRWEGAHEGEVIAIRDFSNSVWFALGPSCCDAGGIIGNGTIHGDTVRGRWYIDTDARRVFGDFQLVRLLPSRPRAQN